MAERKNGGAKRDWRFWMMFACITLCQFLTAFELSAVSTALPTIINALHGDQFVWIGSAYTICSTAFVPLSGGLAQTFGRKIMMCSSVAIFAVGSIICGAAPSMNILIVGRAVQGMGAGGVASLCHIILSDLIPLKDRGIFNGFIAMAYTVANGLGPIVGGVLAQHGQWRWLFYLNAPICGVTGTMVGLFLNLRTPPGRLSDKLRNFDWFGNVLVVAATTTTMIGLTWGGVQFSWSSAHILVPLILGIIGLVAFLVYEAYIPEEPIIPYSLMATRTSLSGYLQTFTEFIVVVALIYYLPVFFQACKGASPIKSGIDMFGIAFSIAPSSIAAGFTIAATHQYRPQIWISWVLAIIATGLLTTLRADSPSANAIGFQVIAGFGFGIMTAAMFNPILAPLPIESSTHAIALYTFVRNFANILGVTIPGAVLQNELQKRLPADFFAQFPRGTEVAYSVIPLISTLEPELRTQVQVAFAGSLQVVWQVLTGICGLGLLLSLAMKKLPLHTHTDENWGAKDSGPVAEVELGSTPKEVYEERLTTVSTRSE